MQTKVYVYAVWDRYDKKWNYRAYPYTMDSKEYVLNCERVVEFAPYPEAELTARLIDQLKEKKTEIIAEAHAETVEIDREIQELLALEDHSNGN